MMRNFVVSGTNWMSQININTDDIPADQLLMEVATRAVERHFRKRSDVFYKTHDPICLTKEERAEDEFKAILVDLLTTELEEGCGIGTMIFIMDCRDDISENEDSEWFISSKPVLENVGIPSLIQKFIEKYPIEKSETH